VRAFRSVFLVLGYESIHQFMFTKVSKDESSNVIFNTVETLHKLAHFLPAQSPLKDFIHHNTLHAFQDLPFHEALRKASAWFGYKVYLSLTEYRNLYHSGQIHDPVLDKCILEITGTQATEEWKHKLLYGEYDISLSSRIGLLRNLWKEHYRFNLDKAVFPFLFRVVGSYLDQGVSIWQFPETTSGFLASLRNLEKNNLWGLLKGERAKKLLLDEETTLEKLLEIVVGKPEYFEQYLFDQQFSHPGWSGMVSVIEHNTNSLLDKRDIGLHDFIFFELILEIDALDSKFNAAWAPLSQAIEQPFQTIWGEVPERELDVIYKIWQEAYEWSYFDQVLKGLSLKNKPDSESGQTISFQAIFCIDDRECSLRRYIEQFDSDARTYGTPGFFNVEFYFRPEHGKFHTKVCPAPLNPKYLIKETESRKSFEKDVHFTRHTHGFLGGWIISQTFGFWSAVRLFINIFKPSKSPAMVSSSAHMDKFGKLSIEFDPNCESEEGLQVGFKTDEMADRVEGLLKSIGLLKDFAPLIYVVGHGASSINNTHYAGYDCGACSGRPGSVNARVFSYMANHREVRKILAERGIVIPENTLFIGALHDTTRDEIDYFPEKDLTAEHSVLFQKHREIFEKALHSNAKERSRRFILTDSRAEAAKVHEKVKLRSVSLFEPRPELNHATNALCIVGRREFNRHLFLDRRSFLNSYDYRTDNDGNALLSILKAAAPVCGGINLEYYFSRVDNHKLGAGTKLPHNVMGLIGVANGMDGDLRPGLPMQMVEVHDPVRLLIIVEQTPEMVLDVIQRNASTYEWFKNEWVLLSVIDPVSLQVYVFKQGKMMPYECVTPDIPKVQDIEALMESTDQNIPVLQLI
jgi:uncharacterized protein YbcC (UPF0753/DUF2309 family)